MKIQGRYVCQVELSLSVDENTEGLKPFEEIREAFTGDILTTVMTDIISRKIDETGITVTVTKMHGGCVIGE